MIVDCTYFNIAYNESINNYWILSNKFPKNFILLVKKKIFNF